jgi:hypothetical protein
VSVCSLDHLLDPAEVLEIFKKHDSDPATHSVQELASFYDVQSELIEYLLKYTRPPVVVEADGILFGVYAVKSMQ